MPAILHLPELGFLLQQPNLTMPPPLPSRQLGHHLGDPTARVNLSAYLDYMCPFSKKAYATLRNKVAPHYKDKSFRFIFYHQVQPWHPQSVLTHEAGLAVSISAGEEAFWKFSDVLYERQEEFVDMNVADKTRNQINEGLAAIAAEVGASKEAVLGLLSLASNAGTNPASNIAKELKFEIKHARTMGIHVSPTTAINDVLFDSSSSWGLEEWKEVLDPLVG